MNRFVILVLALCITSTLAKVCHYKDACNQKPISANVGHFLEDSCPIQYKVLHDCKLKFIKHLKCCYTDACNHKKICAFVDHVLKDSCGKKFLVKKGCKLIPV